MRDLTLNCWLTGNEDPAVHGGGGGSVSRERRARRTYEALHQVRRDVLQLLRQGAAQNQHILLGLVTVFSVSATLIILLFNVQI